MQYSFFICDVFTRERFGGNQLAVVPAAEGLSDGQMQAIAREFNFSETTFVLPAQRAHRRVRIFTPERELPFAGHPNIGTAFVLTQSGNLELDEDIIEFEELAGLVPLRCREHEARPFFELQAPQALRLGGTLPPRRVAEALSLEVREIRSHVHPPRVASVGLPFVIVEVADRQALARAAAVPGAVEPLAPDTGGAVLVYTQGDDAFDLYARMFVTGPGVREDPATGSANLALGALLAQGDGAGDGEFSWRVAQGVETGRPSELFLRVRKQDSAIDAAFVGGHCAMVAEGTIQV